MYKCKTKCVGVFSDVNMDFYIDGVQFYPSPQIESEIQVDITNSYACKSVVNFMFKA